MKLLVSREKCGVQLLGGGHVESIICGCVLGQCDSGGFFCEVACWEDGHLAEDSYSVLRCTFCLFVFNVFVDSGLFPHGVQALCQSYVHGAETIVFLQEIVEDRSGLLGVWFLYDEFHDDVGVED